jgi:hypothetical protein
MNTEKKNEVKILKMNVLEKDQLQSGKGNYYQIHCKNKTSPLHLCISHEDYSFLGVQVFWSRKCKHPYIDDSDGYFNAVALPS